MRTVFAEIRGEVVDSGKGGGNKPGFCNDILILLLSSDESSFGVSQNEVSFRILLGFGRSFFHLLVRDPHLFP
jgi:hypothetical protein